jgi:hypothetical protein
MSNTPGSAWSLIPYANTPQDRRTNLFSRFALKQRNSRRWLPFREVAEWIADIRNPGVSYIDAYDQALLLLLQATMSGLFDVCDRSQVLCLSPFYSPWPWLRLRLTGRGIENHLRSGRGTADLMPHCWVPRRLAEAWCKTHSLPKLPAKFDPLTPEPPAPPAPARRPVQPAVLPVAKQRGPKPTEFERVKVAMLRDLEKNPSLFKSTDEALASDYKTSRSTARKVRLAIQSEKLGQTRTNSDK